MLRRLWIAFVSIVLVGPPVLAQPAPGSSPDGFVPLSSLPPGQELPAAPFLIGAYAFFLVLMMVYLWTIWKRIGRVEKDLQEFERRHGGAAR